MKISFEQLKSPALFTAGILFFGVGVWMIIDGIVAQGVIDLKMPELLSGHLETGSAGLFVAFFSFWMIVLSCFIGRKPNGKPKLKHDNPFPSKMPVAVTVIFILWAVTVTFYVLGHYFDSHNDSESVLFYVLAVIFFGLSCLWSFGTFMCWVDEHQQRKAWLLQSMTPKTAIVKENAVPPNEGQQTPK